MPVHPILIIFLTASGKSDYVEVYCGNEMRKYLGLTRDEQGSRTVPPKTEDGVGVTGSPTNGTAPDTPNIISDMGRQIFCYLLCPNASSLENSQKQNKALIVSNLKCVS